MIAYDRNKPLFSLHRAKSGGTSVRFVLDQWFGDGLYLHYFNNQRWTYPAKVYLWDDPQRTRFRPDLCIHGHFNATRGFGLWEYYPEAEQFITILRHPMERVKSFYFFFRRNPHLLKEHQIEFVGDSSFTLADYVEYMNRKQFNPFPFTYTHDNFKELFHARFVFVGITEYMQHSINLLAAMLGKPPLEVPKENVGEYSAQVSDDVRKSHEAAFAIEYEIYDYFKNRLLEQVGVKS